MSVVLALVACLDETRSVHSVTFKRAVTLFERYAAEHGMDVVLNRYNDDADAITAAAVAHQIVQDRPHAVIGHFASAAADAAAPLYASAGLPLFLPAATARHLTRYATTWRICADDGAYAQAVAGFCQAYGVSIDNMEHDGSVHGKSLAQAMPLAPAKSLPAAGQRGVMYIGNCRNSISFLNNQAETGLTVILTDDALAPEIIEPANQYPGEVLVVGIVPRPEGEVAKWFAATFMHEFGHEPGCYFWETIAAMQVATAVAMAGGQPDSCIWPSVLGPVSFNAAREAGAPFFTLFRVTQGGFEKIAS